MSRAVEIVKETRAPQDGEEFMDVTVLTGEVDMLNVMISADFAGTVKSVSTL